MAYISTDIDEGGFMFGKTTFQIQTSIGMTLTIAVLVLIFARKKSTTIPSNKDIWMAIITSMVALTSGKRFFKLTNFRLKHLNVPDYESMLIL